MNARLLDVVRIANREFRDFVATFSEQGPGHGQYAEAARRLGRVSLRLKQVERVLADGAKRHSEQAGAEQELLDYEQNLMALKRIVEGLESMLLERKSRFEDIRAHLHAANAWASSLHQIS